MATMTLADYPVTLESTEEPGVWRVSVLLRDTLCITWLPLREAQVWVAALAREADRGTYAR